MGTIVSFHAHPDDESIGASGTLSRAVDAGHRVVLVFGTRGELGEPVPGVLAEGEQLAMRRTAEVYESARIIGAERVEFLGYTDSGMMGEATNEAPWCFWQADVDHAARRLAAILDEERPDVLTVYDDNGGYGHPDHVQVHRVGRRAGELAGVPHIFESTMNRDHLREGMALITSMNLEDGDPGDGPNPDDLETFGTPAAGITHQVDVNEYLHVKRASMRCHRSQMADDHFMLRMPDDVFGWAFGTEWYINSNPSGSLGPLAQDLFQPLNVS